MAPSLDDLPVELVERVVDYLPHRETLLHLRQVSPSLNAKVTRCFCKTYFTSSLWRLKSTSSRAIVHFSHSPDVAAHLTTVVLTAPCANHANYDNVWMAKAIEPAKIARALSLFTEVKRLALNNFGSIQGISNTSAFFHPFVSNLKLPKLEILDLFQVDIEAGDVMQLLKKHDQTIKQIELDRVDLRYRPDTEAPEEETPWFDILYSMKDFKNHCKISIDWAKQNGEGAHLKPPWADWIEDAEHLCKGLSIDLMPDDPEDENWEGGLHVVIEIEGDENWWDGVRLIAAYNIFDIIPAPDEDEKWVDCHTWDLPMDYWHGKIGECLAKKAKLAANRDKRAAKALKKQKEDQVGAAFMRQWLTK